jgi:hypothetical protein
MIRTRVSAVLITRDAVTGKALSRDVTVTLNGEVYRPEYRAGGYILFLNLPGGEYEVSLKSARYFEEHLTLFVGAARNESDESGESDESDERVVSLRPRAARVIERGGFSPGGLITVAYPRVPELKTAQEINPGESKDVRLFCRSPAALPPLPAEYLLTDGGDSERNTLRALSADGTGDFAKPFKNAHKRGCALLPGGVYRAEMNGEISASIPNKAAVFFDEEKQELTSIEPDGS